MHIKLLNKQTKFTLIGLGYTGLPIAMEFARHASVIGFDINEDHLSKFRNCIDPYDGLPTEVFEHKDITFTFSIEKLREASSCVVVTPTPIDNHDRPDLSPLLGTARTVGEVSKRGDYIIYGSTVYPEYTEEDCIPILEGVSGLRVGEDSKVGYSPERISLGDRVHALVNTVKIVSGYDTETSETISEVYKPAVQVGLHRTPSIKVTEAAKIIEGTQRNVNIALMNELSIISDRAGVNTLGMLKVTKTKWNFLPLPPGLVDGHCIRVNPYYLVHKAKELQYHAKMINSNRYVNDPMGRYIRKKVAKKIISQGKNVLGAHMLMMSVTFRENISDIRNSKVADIINEFKDFGAKIDMMNPPTSPLGVLQEYGIRLVERPGRKYDVVVIAIVHATYLRLDESCFMSTTNEHAMLVDVKGVYWGSIHQMIYWSL